MQKYKDEVKRIDSLIADLYSTVCFEKGSKPNLEKMKELFLQDGKMIVNDGKAPLIMTVEDYIAMFYDRLKEFEFESLYEGELWSKTQIFERIAHRFSTYELKASPDASEPFSMGINSIQLVKIEDSWIINSMIWNENSKDLIVPPEYL